MDRPTFVKIRRVVEETPSIKTLYFDYPPAKRAIPGQFVMVNVIGVDEIPMSLSSVGSEKTSITVRRVNQATSRVHELSDGDPIGVRGPYGRGFVGVTKGSVMVVGGGVGMAPLLPLIYQLGRKRTVRVNVAIGSRTKEELLFLEGVRRAVGKRGKVLLATDDGSCGAKGFVTTLTEKLLKGKIDMVYTCGPERMMRGLYDQCKRFGVPLQASLERYMRCSVGLCGSCVVGPYRVCTDGPVFTNEQLKEVENEFGQFRRDACGRRVSLSSL